MIRHHLFPLLIGAATLAGCATDGSDTAARRAVVTQNVYAEAESALVAGHKDKAVALLRTATLAHPVDKKPWVRMAQIRFDSSQYGEAISHAQEALARDPDDTLAYSILAVSGLRVASKALSDLTRKNNLKGSVRSEAQDLAKLLRTSLNEEVLVTTRPAARKESSARRAPSQPAVAAPSRPAPGSPFDVLK